MPESNLAMPDQGAVQTRRGGKIILGAIFGFLTIFAIANLVAFENDAPMHLKMIESFNAQFVDIDGNMTEHIKPNTEFIKRRLSSASREKHSGGLSRRVSSSARDPANLDIDSCKWHNFTNPHKRFFPFSYFLIFFSGHAAGEGPCCFEVPAQPLRLSGSPSANDLKSGVGTLPDFAKVRQTLESGMIL